MFSSFFTSNNPNKRWLRFLIFFALIVFVILTYKHFLQKSVLHHEGFSQDSPFLMKHEEDVYDSFYAQIYDQIMEPSFYDDFLFTYALRITKPTKQSFFLDTGCGTGYLVHKLNEYGYQSIGIDKSKAMLDVAKQKYSNIQVIQDNFEDPMAFDKQLFTHIICNHFTIYSIQDKVSFFRNCFYWLLPQGFFILHLVDKNTFEPILSIGKPQIMNTKDSLQQFSNVRITETVVDFIDFQYKSTYHFNNDNDVNNDTIVFTEKFTDSVTSHVRENEQTLYMNNITDIVKDVQFSGFILYDTINFIDLNGDKNQFLYIFQKPV